MAFDPISWMVSYSLGRIAGRILQPSKNRQLANQLRQTLEDWAKNNHPPVQAGTLDTIFSLDVDESRPERLAARRRLTGTILDKRVPSARGIRAALLERWDEIRDGSDHEDLVEFFQQTREAATAQLEDLAARIQTVLRQDARLFQVTAGEHLETIREQVENIRSLMETPSAGRQHVEDDSPVFTVPYQRHTCFKGREDVLADLRRSLVGDKRAALTQVISGLGGIGKTQTAVEYAYENREEYKAVLWVKAATELEIRQDMADAARLLKLPHDETNLEDAVRALKNWLEQNSDWLLVFDNADHPERVKPFMPRSPKGHILLTSRASVFGTLGILNPIELPLLSVEDAAEFLLKRTGHDGSDDAEVESARELANELGLLPLALEQAGAYIHELRLSFTDCLDRYRRRRLEFLERGQPIMGDYPESVATTWAVNFEEVESESEASADLLRLSAFLSPDNIPFELLLRGVSATDSLLAETISESDDPELILREALRSLAKFSLATISGTSESYGTHRLVQEAVKHSLSESGCRKWTGQAVCMVNKAFPSVEFENWNLCRRLVSHAVVATTQAEVFAIQISVVADLATQTAYFLCEQAQYAEAEPLYKQSLEVRRVAVGEQHPDYATSLNDLAVLYWAIGRYAEAEPLYKQSMETWRVALGEQHPDFARSLNNLAVLYWDMGRHAEAEPLHKQSMEIRRVAVGEQHPEFAHSLNNLAELYRVMGRYADAEPLYKQSMEIRRVALGEQHPEFAQSLNNLAGLYKNMGRHAEAEPLYKQSMEIWRVALGEQHPEFATGLSNLAGLYKNMGRHAEAEPLFRRSIEIRRDALGVEHPDFATSLSNLAKLYRVMGRDDEATELEVTGQPSAMREG